MLQARTLDHVVRLRAAISRIGRISDSIISIGPFGIGLDGVLAWIPLLPVGTVYSLSAAIFLIVQGFRAHVPLATLVQAIALLTARTGVTAAGEVIVPFLPAEVLVDFFRAHKWTADMMLKAIDETEYVEGRRDTAHPTYQAARAGTLPGGKRRVVFLG